MITYHGFTRNQVEFWRAAALTAKYAEAMLHARVAAGAQRNYILWSLDGDVESGKRIFVDAAIACLLGNAVEIDPGRHVQLNRWVQNKNAGLSGFGMWAGQSPLCGDVEINYSEEPFTHDGMGHDFDEFIDDRSKPRIIFCKFLSRHCDEPDASMGDDGNRLHWPDIRTVTLKKPPGSYMPEGRLLNDLPQDLLRLFDEWEYTHPKDPAWLETQRGLYNIRMADYNPWVRYHRMDLNVRDTALMQRIENTYCESRFPSHSKTRGFITRMPPS